jgi:hypothetical protein
MRRLVRQPSSTTALPGTVQVFGNVTIVGLVAQANVQALAGLVDTTSPSGGGVTIAGPVVTVTVTAHAGHVIFPGLTPVLRTLFVPAESRVTHIQPDDRVDHVPADTRHALLQRT